MRFVLRVVFTIGAAVIATGDSASAQNVHWNVAAPLAAGQRASLDLVFEDCAPIGDIKIPKVAGLEVLGRPGESRQFSVVNMRSTSSVTLKYSVRAKSPGRLVVPVFTVPTTKGDKRVAAMPLTVTRASVAGRNGSVPVGDVAGAVLIPAKRRPYEGEVFPIDFYISVKEGRRGKVIGGPEWNQQSLTTEGWSEGRVVPLRRLAAAYRLPGSQGVRFRTRAVARDAGERALPPASQDLDLETGRRDRGFFFSEPEHQRVTATSNSPRIDVRPLPTPAPDGFTGAVGEFELRSTVVPEEVAVGEPVTWTLRLEGTGNWPGGVSLPARAIPVDVRTVQPKTQRDFEENQLFTGAVSEDLVLIPSRAGDLTLAPVEVVYFDPETEAYRTLIAEPPTIRVRPSATADSRPGLDAARESVVSAVAPEMQRAAGVGVSPALERLPGVEDEPLLPRDVIAGTRTSMAPFPRNAWLGVVATAPVALAAWWLALAFGRARRSDPHLAGRESLRAMREAVADLENAVDRASQSRALQRWQGATATALAVDHAAPTLAEIATENVALVGHHRQDWVGLWSEADEVIYGTRDRVADGWAKRAEDAATQVPAPRFNPFRTLLPKNLFALGALAGALLLPGLGAAVRAAADAEAGVEAYRRAEFLAARDAFAARVAEAPGDPVARYNLGLTEAQLGDRQRALAHTTSAFLRAPRTDAFRWNLGVFASELARIDPAVERIAFGGGAAWVARQASPAGWQLLAVLASVGVCSAAGVGLRRRFSGAAGGRAWTGPVAVASLAAALLSAVALSEYGNLGTPAAAMLSEDARLRSVPTDADTPQTERPIPAGSLVTIEREFLTWRQVRRANGETGWLRTTTLVDL